MIEGWITYRDIKENRIDLCDLDRMHELLLVRMINEKRMTEAARRQEAMMGKPADLPMVGDLGTPPPSSNSFDDDRWKAINERWNRR